MFSLLSKSLVDRKEGPVLARVSNCPPFSTLSIGPVLGLTCYPGAVGGVLTGGFAC